MKPVIKKQTYCSVLLMRDDGGVRSFRMKNTTLRFLFISCLVFFLLGGLGIGAGIHYWKRYAEFMPDYREKQRLLAEVEPELIRLQSVEAVCRAQSNGSLPVAMNTEVGVDTPESVLLSTQTNGTGSSNGTGSLETAGLNGSESASAGESRNAALSDGNETAPATGGAEQGIPSLSGASSPIRVNEFSSQALDLQMLRIRYELSAVRSADSGQENSPVSGFAKYVAIFSDGTSLELTQQNPGNARFSINWMKPMVATCKLPAGYSTADIKHLDVFIEVSGGSVYKDRFPFLPRG